MGHYAKKIINKDVEKVQEKESYQSNSPPRTGNESHQQITKEILRQRKDLPRDVFSGACMSSIDPRVGIPDVHLNAILTLDNSATRK